MKTVIVEATSDGGNWGKFLVARFTDEWHHRSALPENQYLPLLTLCGWGGEHIWVADLQTGEGALFRPGGYPKADLAKHRIWVCPLFEPFLTWLYEQNLGDLDQLPASISLPNAPFAFSGYRRPGPEAADP
jgi:hypothetical protein